jgi:hypothetical protein
MKKITKRDVLFFFIGLFTMLIIETIYNWPESVNSFKAGLKDGAIDGAKAHNTEELK